MAAGGAVIGGSWQRQASAGGDVGSRGSSVGVVSDGSRSGGSGSSCKWLAPVGGPWSVDSASSYSGGSSGGSSSNDSGALNPGSARSCNEASSGGSRGNNSGCSREAGSKEAGSVVVVRGRANSCRGSCKGAGKSKGGRGCRQCSKGSLSVTQPQSLVGLGAVTTNWGNLSASGISVSTCTCSLQACHFSQFIQGSSSRVTGKFSRGMVVGWQSVAMQRQREVVGLTAAVEQGEAAAEVWMVEPAAAGWRRQQQSLHNQRGR